jgi:glycine/serine hydroxymethyltransferase
MLFCFVVLQTVFVLFVCSFQGTRVQPSKTGPPKQSPYTLDESINFAVFPSVQGGPHENTISAIAVAMGEALQPSFKRLAPEEQVIN